MGSKAVLTDTTVKTINRCVCVYINEAFEVSPLTPLTTLTSKVMQSTLTIQKEQAKKTLSKQACPNLAVITTSQSVHY